MHDVDVLHHALAIGVALLHSETVIFKLQFSECCVDCGLGFSISLDIKDYRELVVALGKRFLSCDSNHSVGGKLLDGAKDHSVGGICLRAVAQDGDLVERFSTLESQLHAGEHFRREVALGNNVEVDDFGIFASRRNDIGAGLSDGYIIDEHLVVDERCHFGLPTGGGIITAVLLRVEAHG